MACDWQNIKLDTVIPVVIILCAELQRFSVTLSSAVILVHFSPVVTFVVN